MMEKDNLSEIKLLILDVDGVMTDGRITIDDSGRESRSFDVKDGLGLKLLMEEGIEVAVVTAKNSRAVEKRIKGLGIRELFQGVQDKESVCQKLIKNKKLKSHEVCCMGDDLQDLPLYKRAGIAVAVADASHEVREAAHLVTRKKGGRGAVREICERILKARNRWPAVISRYKE